MKTILLVKLLLTVSLLINITCFDKVEDLFKDPDTNPVKKVLEMTIPLAYASNLATAALNGEKMSNVSFVKGGDSTLGNFLISISIDNTFPLPEGIQANGKILVAGIAARQKVYMMSIIFTQLNITRGQFLISDVSTIPVIQDEDLITGKKQLFVVYSDLDLNRKSDTLLNIDMNQNQSNNEYKRYENMKSFDGSTILEQNTWIIKIDNSNTPSDPSDDLYSVSGAGQYIEAGSSNADLLQIIMVSNSMKPTCKLNPGTGWAMIQSIESGSKGSELGHLLLNSHSRCDGTMDATVATGVYSRSMGKSIKLNLGK